jgi:hypothetical protein
MKDCGKSIMGTGEYDVGETEVMYHNQCYTFEVL